MKNIMRSFIVVILVSCVGCSPQKRLARLLEKYPIPRTVDTIIITNTEYRSDTVYELLIGEAEKEVVHIPVEVDLPYTSLRKTTTLAEATAWVSDNRLGLSLIQYDTLFQFILDSVIVEHTDTIKIVEEIPYPVIEKPNPFWKHGFFVLVGVFLVSLILLFLLVFRKKV